MIEMGEISWLTLLGVVIALLGFFPFGERFDEFHRRAEQTLIKCSRFFGVSGPYEAIASFFLIPDQRFKLRNFKIEFVGGFFQSYNFLLVWLWLSLISYVMHVIGFLPLPSAAHSWAVPLALFILVYNLLGFELVSGMSFSDLMLQFILTAAVFTAVGYVLVFVVFVLIGAPIHLLGIFARIVRLAPRGAASVYGLLLAIYSVFQSPQ